ncbi:hypothetical protein ACFLSJ_06640 [Verrucomicrobiota bacterium]
MTPEERVSRCVDGGHADKVPFTMYSCPQNAVEREMRNMGMCLVDRGGPVCSTTYPNVHMHRTVEWNEDYSLKMIRTFYDTPVGTVSTLHQEGGGRPGFMHEKMWKSAEDYRTILFILKDARIEQADFGGWASKSKAYGGDHYIRGGIGIEPLQLFISEYWMDMQDFCIEWMDSRDEILGLYEAMVENNRKVYPMAAASPARIIDYGGNVVADIIGRDTYEQYFVPHYREAADILHGNGKLLASHYDANCGLLRDLIATSGLDCIEAFTPAPDTDMTLREARDAWPDKILWCNFPSSVHLRDDSEVEQFTVNMLNELDSVDGIIMGITEDLPAHRGLDSCLAVMNGLERHARERPELYG